MSTLASWGLATMSVVGILSILMARYENEILTIIGYLVMIGLVIGGIWYMTSTITSTFFF